MHAWILLVSMLVLQTSPPADKQPSGDPAPPPVTPTQPPAPTIQPIRVGSPAPKLSVDTWVQGDPVSGIEPGKVHVIEFWATWCRPCLQSMPHLTRLQRRHPEVVLVGVAGMERGKPPADGAADPRLDRVRAMVAQRKNDIGYRIAFDADESMVRDWFVAARQRTIPCAMVVGRDGRIAWIGPPVAIDAAVEKALQQPTPGTGSPGAGQ